MMIRNLMRTDPGKRVTVQNVCEEPVVCRARAWMAKKRAEASKEGLAIILGSPLAEERDGFIRDVLGVEHRMELC
jgi:mitosis inhibitor protein kinase SWE1